MKQNKTQAPPGLASPQARFRHDLVLFTTMAVLAACGLIYEYLLSHYAGRVLGAIEQVICAMIGVMIVAMGVGAFLARWVRDPFTGFAWLELGVALLGVSAVLLIGAMLAFASQMPSVIAEVYGLPPDLAPNGGLVAKLIVLSERMPYVVGFLLGVMIGMEIPLIAQVRVILHGAHPEHNTGSLYGIDYIGAGLGAALWVTFLPRLEIATAAMWTAAANLLAGMVFLLCYRRRIRYVWLLLPGHFVVAILVMAVGHYGADWDAAMEDMLYVDQVIYQRNTQYQHITITERIMDPSRPPVLSFHINGRTQFASNDEKIYHSLLVYPAMAASARHDRILIIGGGDGLALRNVLLWQPQEVVLLDLDKEIVDFFSHPVEVDGRVINERLLALNQHAFADPRVQLLFGDAYLRVDDLLAKQQRFDTILVDLPDPGHSDLNKLYSARFYSKLRHLLSGDGAMAIQSTSPYHAKRAFLCIGKTVRHAGYGQVQQYHHNVPSFGEWGWTIATPQGRSPRQRLQALETLTIDDGWMTKGVMLAAFEFGRNFFADLDEIEVNRIGSNIAYRYHQQDWEVEQGIFQP